MNAMQKLSKIFDAICTDYQLGNWTPIVMNYILQNPAKAEACLTHIKRIVNS